MPTSTGRMPAFSRVDERVYELGESPIWDHRRGIFWFVDARAPAVHSLDPADWAIRTYPMDRKVSCVALAERDRLLLAMTGGVFFWSPETNDLRFLVDPEPDMPMNNLNDGRAGPDGCFWIGSMHSTVPRKPTGSLYRITPAGECRRVRGGICVSNGLAWSPDGGILYHADSRARPTTGEVRTYALDAVTGRIGPETVLAILDEAEGLPDGAAMDEHGRYWSAGISASCLNLLSPDGTRLGTIALPVGAPTMPCFGGEDLDLMIVTSLTRRLDDGRDHVGHLLVGRPDVRGCREHTFAG